MATTTNRQLRALMEESVKWAVENIGGELTEADAPSGVAWKLRTMARDNPDRFFQSVVPKYVKDQEESTIKDIAPADKKTLQQIERMLKDRLRLTEEEYQKIAYPKRISHR